MNFAFFMFYLDLPFYHPLLRFIEIFLSFPAFSDQNSADYPNNRVVHERSKGELNGKIMVLWYFRGVKD